MGLIDLITGSLGDNLTNNGSQKQGIDKGKWMALAAVAIPLIISQLKKNAQSSPEEAANINNALQQHDGSVLNNPEQVSEDDGNSILNHIFGGNRGKVEQDLAGKTGISMDKIGPVLASLAPMVMGYIGKEKTTNAQANGGGGITDLLGGILGNEGGESALGSLAGQLLGGQSGKQSNGGGILGGLLNLFKK